MLIREYQEKDKNDLKILIQELHNLHVKNRPDIYKTIKEISEEFINQTLSDINLIVIEKEKVIGLLIASIKKTKENEIMYSYPFIYIEAVVIKEEYKNHKIGTKLYEELEKIAKKKKITKIELNVWSFNNNAIEFYKTLGFKVKNMKLEKEMNEWNIK